MVMYNIELTEEPNFKTKCYRLSPRQRDISKKKFKKTLKLGVIVEGTSEVLSPMILVEVAGKDPRPCVDYRQLHAITKSYAEPLPNIEDRLHEVAQANFISLFDL